MALDLGVLPKVLFSPKAAFESIKDKTSMGDGIIMYLILGIVSFIISAIITIAAFGTMVSPGGAAFGTGWAIVGLVIGLVVGIVFLIIVALLAAKIATALTKGNYNMEKTVGFLGYGEIVGLVMGVLISLVMVGVGYSLVSVGPGGIPAANMSALGIISMLGIMAFIWQLYVNGAGVAVANDVGLGIGIVSYFVAALIIGLIVAVVVVAIIAAVGLSMWNAGAFGGF